MWWRGLGSRESSKVISLDSLLSLQPLLCITIFDVRSKGTANKRFTKVHEENLITRNPKFVLLMEEVRAIRRQTTSSMQSKHRDLYMG